MGDRLNLKNQAIVVVDGFRAFETGACTVVHTVGGKEAQRLVAEPRNFSNATAEAIPRYW